jgi:hypothetical protein
MRGGDEGDTGSTAEGYICIPSPGCPAVKWLHIMGDSVYMSCSWCFDPMEWKPFLGTERCLIHCWTLTIVHRLIMSGGGVGGLGEGERPGLLFNSHPCTMWTYTL